METDTLAQPGEVGQGVELWEELSKSYSRISHLSLIADAPWREGGGVSVTEIPEERLELLLLLGRWTGELV